MEFTGQLALITDEQPRNDVWALVRSRTRPKTLRPLVWLHSLVATNMRRAATATVAVVLILVAIYGVTFINPEPSQTVRQNVHVVAVNTDDPLAHHTDAMIDYIDNL